MTLTQKILAHHAVGLRRPYVQAGDTILVRVDWVIASELAWGGMDRTYTSLGRPPPKDPGRVFLAVDHTVDPATLPTDERAKRLVRLAERFARESGLRHYFGPNETILHTRFFQDLVQPGELVLGADSHTTSHGAAGAFAIGLGGADVTAAMVLGQTWLEVPEAISVELSGRPGFGLSGKEVVLETLRRLRRNKAALERTVEYRGEGARALSPDARFTVANMTAELGGLNGIFEADGVIRAWLDRRAGNKDSALFFRADPGARYAARYEIDLTRLAPLVAKPYSPDNVVEVGELVGLSVDGAFIGACTTTEEELILGALVLEKALERGAPLRAGANARLVVPGSRDIERRLGEAGLLDVYRRGGFVVGAPGCSMCLGIAGPKAARGEVWLSSQNRNFANRMGEGSSTYLASAATVAASAPGLRISDPRPLLARVDQERYRRLLAPRRGPVPEVGRDEPEIQLAPAVDPGRAPTALRQPVRGRVQRFGHHVDTDAIIPAEFCHLATPEELGQHCFEHVRPAFRGRAREGGSVIVAGEGWGSGSSREQAVWALVGAGVRAIVAKSFAFIHRRNLVNEAVPHLTVVDPAFYELATEGAELEVDVEAGTVTDLASGRVFQARPTGRVAKELGRAGGLVQAVRGEGPRILERLASGPA